MSHSETMAYRGVLSAMKALETARDFWEKRRARKALKRAKALYKRVFLAYPMPFR